MNEKLIIAIDGYSSSGKSTFAKMIAEELNYIHIDSGAMYRAATLFFMRKGYLRSDRISYDGIIEDVDQFSVSFRKNEETGKRETFLNDENVEAEIRDMAVSEFVSPVSTIKEVRDKMVDLQRLIGKDKGIVMDGRDIGTVVFPDADIKIFMTSCVDVRALRRYKELTGKGLHVDLNTIKNNIMTRDITDENREIGPLRRADDAVVLDNSRMTVKSQMEWFRKLFDSKIKALGLSC